MASTSVDYRAVHPFRNNKQGSENTPTSTNTSTSVSVAKNWNQNHNSTQYNITDYKFTPYPLDPNSIPKLQITEFQSSYLFNWVNQLNNLINSIDAGLGEVKNLTTQVNQLANNIQGSTPEAKLAALLNETEGGFSRSSILGRPIEMIREMFQGRYIGTYELPFFGDNYFAAKSISNWGNGEVGGLASTINSVLRKGTNVDYPITPTWTNSASTDIENVNTEIVLYNDSIDSLKKNFKFLHSFAGGAFWVQENYRQLQPNLYDVHYPGHFQYYYCALDLVVTTVGMKRRLNSLAYKDFASSCGINISSDTMFPDAYRMKIEFKPLIPNNFNVYIKYLLEGKDSEVEVGGYSLYKSSKYLLGKESIGAKLAEGKNVAGNLLEAGGNLFNAATGGPQQ